jgi:hypothetical protein
MTKPRIRMSALRVKTVGTRIAPLERVRCGVCGHVVSFDDLRRGRAARWLVTPDSEFTREEYGTLCSAHLGDGAVGGSDGG